MNWFGGLSRSGASPTARLRPCRRRAGARALGASSPTARRALVSSRAPRCTRQTSTRRAYWLYLRYSAAPFWPALPDTASYRHCCCNQRPIRAWSSSRPGRAARGEHRRHLQTLFPRLHVLTRTKTRELRNLQHLWQVDRVAAASIFRTSIADTDRAEPQNGLQDPVQPMQGLIGGPGSRSRLNPAAPRTVRVLTRRLSTTPPLYIAGGRGHTVDAAADGITASPRGATVSTHLVDLGLPGMDGMTLCRSCATTRTSIPLC